MGQVPCLAVSTYHYCVHNHSSLWLSIVVPTVNAFIFFSQIYSGIDIEFVERGLAAQGMSLILPESQ